MGAAYGGAGGGDGQVVVGGGGGGGGQFAGAQRVGDADAPRGAGAARPRSWRSPSSFPQYGEHRAGPRHRSRRHHHPQRNHHRHQQPRAHRLALCTARWRRPARPAHRWIRLMISPVSRSGSGRGGGQVHSGPSPGGVRGEPASGRTRAAAIRSAPCAPKAISGKLVGHPADSARRGQRRPPACRSHLKLKPRLRQH